MKKIIIAVDGFSSTGKSTIAKGLAKKLNYIYIDTGAMYRAVTLLALRHNCIKNDIIDVQSIINILKNTQIHFKNNPITGNSEIHLNQENVEDLIRDISIAQKVSLVAKEPEIRHFLVNIQQIWGKEKGIVMDGRDIGSVVFPKAELKIFMTASDQIRAQRRLNELINKGQKVSFENVLQNLKERDFIDSTRKESPLIKPYDAIEIDNSYTEIEPLINQIVLLALQKMKEA